MTDIQKEVQKQARNQHTVHEANCDICRFKNKTLERNYEHASQRANVLRADLERTAAQLAIAKANQKIAELNLAEAQQKDSVLAGMRRKIQYQAEAIRDLHQKLDQARTAPTITGVINDRTA